MLGGEPDFAPAHFGLGCVHLFTGASGRTVEEWDRRLEVAPSHGEAYHAPTWTHDDAGDYVKGCKYTKKAMESGVSQDSDKETFRKTYSLRRIDDLEIGHKVTALHTKDIQFVKYGIEKPPESNRKAKTEETWLKAIPRHLGLGGDSATHILCCLFILLVCFLLLRGTLREGFPRDHLDATLAFYVAKVKMLLGGFRLYTPSWYFGYEILRFYPPLSTFLPYLIARASGNLMLSYYLLCFFFYALSCVGVYFFLRSFMESTAAALFAGVLWSITHVNFVSFQGHYWETARLFGTAAVPWALYSADRAIDRGGRRWTIAVVLTASYALLSNMLSLLDLLVTLLPFMVIRGLVIPPVPRRVRREVRRRTIGILGIGALGVLGLCLWWYVPALLPHGLGAFIAGLNGRPPTLPQVLLQANPPSWMPAVQLPVTALGLMGVATAIYRQERKGMTFVTLFFTSLFTTYLIGVQPVRLILDIGFIIILLSGYFVCNLLDFIKQSSDRLAHIKDRHNEIHNAVISLVLPALIFVYLQGYANFAVVDDTYRSSDEYLTATWLSENVDGDYRVYAMYGDLYRGSQWLNAFYPQVRQVLGGFDQGAKIESDAPFAFDDAIKQGLDPVEIHDLADAYHVKYIVVDETWMRANAPEAYEKFWEPRFFRPVGSINQQLKHAEVFEALGITPLEEKSAEHGYWDVWRYVGILASTISLIIFAYGIMRKELV